MRARVVKLLPAVAPATKLPRPLPAGTSRRKARQAARPRAQHLLNAERAFLIREKLVEHSVWSNRIFRRSRIGRY